MVADKFDEMTFRSARNVGWVQLESASNVTVEQLLKYRAVIFVENAYETLAQRTA